MQSPPDWFVEPLIALTTSIREHTGPSVKGLPVLRVTAELGLVLGIPAGQMIRIHTPGGSVDVAADHVNALPGDPHPDCDGCERLLYEKREMEADRVTLNLRAADDWRARGAPPGEIRDVGTAQILAAFAAMTPHERMTVFDALFERYHRPCGTEDPGCQCDNDE